MAFIFDHLELVQVAGLLYLSTMAEVLLVADPKLPLKHLYRPLVVHIAATWLLKYEYFGMRELTPHGHVVLHVRTEG